MTQIKANRGKFLYILVMCGMVLLTWMLTGRRLNAQSCQACQCGVQCNADKTDCSCVAAPSCGGGTATCSSSGWACPTPTPPPGGGNPPGGPTPTPTPTCTGTPSITCPSGASVVCNSYAMWACSDGSSGCITPPPSKACPLGASMVCTRLGWGCSDGSPGCDLPPPNWTWQECTTGASCTSTGAWACNPTSPIIIDTRGEGFHLTDVAHGVAFSFVPGEPPIQVAWTDPNFSNGFLVLDRNGDGTINDGTELFGNLSPQP